MIVSLTGHGRLHVQQLNTFPKALFVFQVQEQAAQKIHEVKQEAEAKLSEARCDHQRIMDDYATSFCKQVIHRDLLRSAQRQTRLSDKLRRDISLWQLSSALKCGFGTAHAIVIGILDTWCCMSAARGQGSRGGRSHRRAGAGVSAGSSADRGPPVSPQEGAGQCQAA